MQVLIFFVMSFSFSVGMFAAGDILPPLESKQALGEAEQLMTDLMFYEALIALEPLLMHQDPRPEQEQALWMAHTLGLEVAEALTAEYDALRPKMDAPQPPDANVFSPVLEKIKVLNRFGAEIHYIEIGGAFHYHCGFLERLVKLYPESRLAPIAEYYLIHKNISLAALDVQKTLRELLAYVKTYANTGYFEVSLAHYDIARLYHGMWALLAYPELDPGVEADYRSGDAAKDKAFAAVCKAEALKFYAKFIISDYQETRWRSPRVARRAYQDLKREENVDGYFLYYD
ncbi:MAG: hypothetical protein OXI43_12145 [Candidatus Poribacteria bacterium]|nr:hypothetical protein [Candidatus Poribacteria bacterium]